MSLLSSTCSASTRSLEAVACMWIHVLDGRIKINPRWSPCRPRSIWFPLPCNCPKKKINLHCILLVSTGRGDGRTELMGDGHDYSSSSLNAHGSSDIHKVTRSVIGSCGLITGQCMQLYMVSLCLILKTYHLWKAWSPPDPLISPSSRMSSPPRSLQKVHLVEAGPSWQMLCSI